MIERGRMELRAFLKRFEEKLLSDKGNSSDERDSLYRWDRSRPYAFPRCSNPLVPNLERNLHLDPHKKVGQPPPLHSAGLSDLFFVVDIDQITYNNINQSLNERGV